VKRLGIISTLSTLVMAVFVALLAPAALAVGTPVFNEAAAPRGTHLQTGTPSCSFAADGLTVICSSYELAGVGNTNATATLETTYSATVDCRNRGGNIVEVKAQLETVPATTGELEPKNGRLTVPSLTSAPVPSAGQFEALAECPNPNWTKITRTGTIALESSIYTLTFEGFEGAFITIIDP
jgi:hypothetical protein